MFDKQITPNYQYFTIYCYSIQQYIYPGSAGRIWGTIEPKLSMSGKTQAECERKWLLAKRRVGKNLRRAERELEKATQDYALEPPNQIYSSSKNAMKRADDEVKYLSDLRGRLETDFVTVTITTAVVPV